jgi:hypothetical protein
MQSVKAVEPLSTKYLKMPLTSASLRPDNEVVFLATLLIRLSSLHSLSLSIINKIRINTCIIQGR